LSCQRELFGLALLTVLAGWTAFGTPIAVAGDGTFTTTTSTTCATTAGCPSRTEESVTTSTTFGPGNILIGEKQSVPFFVAAGTTNVNTNTHTQTFVCAAAAAAPAPALGTGALAGCALLLAAYGHWRVGRGVPGAKA
jgi:hypothetical protein